MRGNPPTLKSIGEKVGVTANTVSLALRNSPLVARETRQRIQKVALEMGYVQNAIAGSLRSGRSNTLAIIMGDIANPILAAKIKALEYVFGKKGLQLMIFNSDESPDRELEAVRTAISRKVDGVILCPCAKSESALALLRQHGIPCVLSGRLDNDGQCDAVVWDDRQGGYLAARHLLDCGCQRIAFLGVTQRISSARDRKLGYLQALEEYGIAPDPALIAEASPTGGDVEKLLLPMLDQGIDGLCAFSDLIAWEAACLFQEKGIRVPEDIQLTGFDDVSSVLRIPYRVTSIACDLKREAEVVSEVLLARIENPDLPPSLHKLETHLAVHGTTLARK